MNEIFVVTVWGIIAFVITVPFAIYGFIVSKISYNVSLPYIPILKYSLVTLFASVIIHLVSPYVLTFPESIYQFIPELLPLLFLGGAIYFGLTYLIDSSTKKLFKSIFNEIIKR